MFIVDLLVRLILIAGGVWLIQFTIITAIRVFVLPRGDNAWLARQIFRFVYNFFAKAALRANSYQEQDRVLALFAPIVLLVQPLIYLAMVAVGYTPIYWALAERPLSPESLAEAFHLSGSSLMTLGYASVSFRNIPVELLSFTQAALGMIIVALLIAYLPAIYAAFSERERQVALLEARAGSPPSGVTLLGRIYRNGGNVEQVTQIWPRWEEWFASIEESHTSLVALVFFRSPMPDRHWVTAAGAILDAASLLDAVVDEPRKIESVLMIRAGYVSLRRIADYFGTIPYDADPDPLDPISITRDEFDEAYDQLKQLGVPVIADRDAAWRNFSGWRVNYDRVLVGLARLTTAPYAPWCSDRSLPGMGQTIGIQPYHARSSE